MTSISASTLLNLRGIDSRSFSKESVRPKGAPRSTKYNEIEFSGFLMSILRVQLRLFELKALENIVTPVLFSPSKCCLTSGVSNSTSKVKSGFSIGCVSAYPSE